MTVYAVGLAPRPPAPGELSDDLLDALWRAAVLWRDWPLPEMTDEEVFMMFQWRLLTLRVR